MLSNGTRRLVLPAYFELLPWGTFPVFTQRSSCHFTTRRFTDLRISRHHSVSPVYFKLTILGNSPFSRFLRLSHVIRTQLVGLSGSSAISRSPALSRSIDFSVSRSPGNIPCIR